uniref:Tail protein n=1 Tax=viral metagenome TaxID=1070528 RepID=A0A6M3IJ84_9ZZZZ
MSWSYDDLIEVSRSITHRGTGETHQSLLEGSLRLAIGEMSRFVEWSFCEEELKIPVEENDRRFDWPTTNADGDTIPAITSVDKQSFCANGAGDIPWEDDIRRIATDDPDWTDGATGDVECITISGGKLSIYRAASAGWVASNPYIYGRGWRSIKQPNSVDGADANLPNFADTVADIPNDYAEGLVLGTNKWVYRQARSDRWVNEHKAFQEFLVEMYAEYSPAKGFSTDSLLVPDVYRSASSGRRWDGNSDYGRR